MYKFREKELIKELDMYVYDTYGQHYANDKYQATDVIIDSGHGEGFCIGNIMKYAKRYGKKEGKERKDLFKILHYALIMLYIHDNGDKITIKKLAEYLKVSTRTIYRNMEKSLKNEKTTLNEKLQFSKLYQIQT